MAIFTRAKQSKTKQQALQSAEEVSLPRKKLSNTLFSLVGSAAILIGVAGVIYNCGSFAYGVYQQVQKDHQEIVSAVGSTYVTSLKDVPVIDGYRALEKRELDNWENSNAVKYTHEVRFQSTDFTNQLPSFDSFLKARHAAPIQASIDSFNRAVKAVSRMESVLAKASAVNGYVCMQGGSHYKASFNNIVAPEVYLSGSWANAMQDMMEGGIAGEKVCIDQAHYQAIMLVRAGVRPEKVFIVGFENTKESIWHAITAVEIEGDRLVLLNNRTLKSEDAEGFFLSSQFSTVYMSNLAFAADEYFGPESDYTLLGMHNMKDESVCFAPDKNIQRAGKIYAPSWAELKNFRKRDMALLKEVSACAAANYVREGKRSPEVTGEPKAVEAVVDDYKGVPNFKMLMQEIMKARKAYHAVGSTKPVSAPQSPSLTPING